MLKITGKDFELVQIKNSNHFSLKMLSIVNEGKANERSELKTKLETVPLDYALYNIVMSRLNNIDKTVSIKEFLDLYKKEIEILEKEILINTI